MAEQAEQPNPEEQFLNSYPEEPASITGEGTKPTEEAPQPESPAAQQSDSEQPTEDSYTGTNLEAIKEGLEDPAARAAVDAIHKSLQGDYTRKAQELAAQKTSLGDNPEEVQEAVEFYNNLREDPTFALEVHEYLSNALEQLGMSPAEAKAEATKQVDAEAATQSTDFDADDDPTAPLKGEVSALQERLDKFEQSERERESRREEDELAAALISQEMALRQSHPAYQDKDFDRIYDLATSTGGNLHEASALYEDMRNDFITSYMSEKGSVTDRVDSPVSGPAQTVREIPKDARGNVDLEAVHKGAMQTLFNHMAEREAHG